MHNSAKNLFVVALLGFGVIKVQCSQSDNNLFYCYIINALFKVTRAILELSRY